MYYIGLITYFFMSMLMAAPTIKNTQHRFADSIITTKIDTKLARYYQLNPLKLHISTQQGIVYLKGSVPDQKALINILRIIKQTKGVKGVNIKHLQVKKVNTAFTDTYITAKVEAAVLKAKVFDDESIPLVGINAHTENGQVILSGFVKKARSIPFIIKRVSEVKGVKRVISHLKVVVSSEGKNA